MAASVIDFTIARLGGGPRGRKIERCPTCGRKGRMTRCLRPTSGGGRPIPPFWVCNHVVELATAYGITVTRVIDHCRGRIVDGIDQPGTARAPMEVRP